MKKILILLLAVIIFVFSSCNGVPYSDTGKNANNDDSSVNEVSNASDESENAVDDAQSAENSNSENAKQDIDAEHNNDPDTDDKQFSAETENVNEYDTEKDAETDIVKEQETESEVDASQNSETSNSEIEADKQNEEKEIKTEEYEVPEKIEGYTNPVTIVEDIENEAELLNKSPAPRLELLKPEASGILQISNEYAVIDYSNMSDGYVMVKYNQPCENRLKAQLKGAGVTYSYNIAPLQWEVFPLSLGSGEYTLTVYKNVVDSKYASVLSTSFDAVINDEFTAFLYPNQYVDYSVAPKTVDKAYELTKYQDDTLMKLSAVYDFVVSTISYDKEKAKNVQSGYLPVLDSVLESKKGICFDYAALMTGMLRSQGIPCKLVVGYAGNSYHAWISVWTKESGWIDGAIYFDGISWHRMDPTFASSSGKSDTIMQYIGDGNNYLEKYLY